MGKAIKSIAKPIGSLFGMGPEYGESFNPERSATDEFRKFSMENPKEVQGIEGTKMATDAIRSNPILAGLYGQGGLQDRLGTEEQSLASRGFSLQQPDYEAYGQASGDIARQFGQQEADLSKSLARRGLASAGSGAAGAGFSGLAGNKNEMLAKAQTDIAQKRMADTQARLQATRSMMAGLGAQGQNAIESQFGRQMAGRQQRAGELGQAAANERGLNTQLLQGLEDKRGAKNQNIGDAWSQGTFSGMRSGTADATQYWTSMGGKGGGMGGGGGGGGMFGG